MNSGSFDGGLLNLTSWVGNAVMPIFAALILAMGIYKYSRGYQIDPYIGGTLAALSVSGLLRLAEVFASQGSGTTQYWSAIDAQQDRRIAHVLTVDEVSLKQPLRNLALRRQTLFQRGCKHYVTAKGVRCTLHPVVTECDSNLRPGGRDLRIEPLRLLPTAELRRAVLLPVKAIDRHIGV